MDAPALAEDVGRLLAGDRTLDEVVFIDPVSGERRRVLPSPEQRVTAASAAALLDELLAQVERLA